MFKDERLCRYWLRKFSALRRLCPNRRGASPLPFSLIVNCQFSQCGADDVFVFCGCGLYIDVVSIIYWRSLETLTSRWLPSCCIISKQSRRARSFLTFPFHWIMRIVLSIQSSDDKIRLMFFSAQSPYFCRRYRLECHHQQ